MKVTLLNKDQLLATPPEVTIGEFARVSTDSDSSAVKIAEHCLKAGHTTPLRSVHFTFHIDGISRACSHQLVRHKIGVDYVQRSQRYVNEDGFRYVEPPSIANSDSLSTKLTYREAMEQIDSAYKFLTFLGIPDEDARYVLPNACETQLNAVFSFHALMNFCLERLCTRAQWEIRAVAQAMAKEVAEVSPLLASYLLPKCDAVGFCPEVQSCGKVAKKYHATKL